MRRPRKPTGGARGGGGGAKRGWSTPGGSPGGQGVLVVERQEVVAEGGPYGETDIVTDRSDRVHLSFFQRVQCPDDEATAALFWAVRSGDGWEVLWPVTRCMNMLSGHRLALAGGEVLLTWIECPPDDDFAVRVAAWRPNGMPEVYTLLDSSSSIPLAVAWSARTLYLVANENRLGYNWVFRVYRKEEGKPFVSLPFYWARYWLDTGGLACDKEVVHLPGQVGKSLGYLVSPDGGQSWELQGVPEFRGGVYKPKVALLGKLRILVWLESSQAGLFADRLVAATSKDGQSWSSPTVLAAPPSSEIILEPELVIGSRSFLLVFWEEGGFFRGLMRCYYRVFDGQTWSGPFPFPADSAMNISTPRGRIEPLSGLVHLSYSALYPSGRDVVWYVTARLLRSGVEPAPLSVEPPPLALGLAYPNPCNGVVTVPVRVPMDAEGEVKVVDAVGRRVAVVWQGRGCGQWTEVRWDGRSAEGVAAPSGLYLVRLRTGASVVTQKVALLR